MCGISCCMHVQVNFLTERGTDTAGMTREFFTLAARDIVGMYMGHSMSKSVHFSA